MFELGLLAAVVLVFSACGRGHTPAEAFSQQEPAELAALHAKLSTEFQRLGIDPSKVAAAAPTGADGAVFDLRATVVDPDGSGGNPPTGIELAWTERLAGDYDQNGEVNIGDLTPMPDRLGLAVSYDSPLMHGAISHWPAGDPDSEGASNWRNARVDGDANGEINISDITPIAVHWRNSLSGYRVYAKAPGEDSFSRLADPSDAGAQLTIKKPVGPSPLKPVRYSFTWNLSGAQDGVYSGYLTAYDKPTQTEGVQSNIIALQLDGGVGNVLPVASISADPPQGVDPQTIDFSAVGSFDQDGSIAAYKWDFDGDGTWDTLDLTAPTASHDYATPGDFPVKLQVHDNSGGVSEAVYSLAIQPSSWARTWGAYPYTETMAVVCDSGGNIYTAGTGGSDADQAYGVLFTKFDAAGNPQWCRILEYPEGKFATSQSEDQSTYALTVLPDGDVMAAVPSSYMVMTSPDHYQTFTDVVLLRMSPEGNLRWSRCWDADDFDCIHELRSLSDGTILASGFIKHLEFIVAEGPEIIQRISSSGEILWQKEILSDGWTGLTPRYEIRDIDVISGAPLILCAAVNTPDTSAFSRFALAALSPDGDVEHAVLSKDPVSLNYDHNPDQFAVGTDGSIYLTTDTNQAAILCLNSDWQERWGWTGLGRGSLTGLGSSVAMLGDGYVAGETLFYTTLVALTSDGAILWDIGSTEYDQLWVGPLTASRFGRLYLASKGDYQTKTWTPIAPDLTPFDVVFDPAPDLKATDYSQATAVDLELQWVTVPVEPAQQAIEGQPRILLANPQGLGHPIP